MIIKLDFNLCLKIQSELEKRAGTMSFCQANTTLFSLAHWRQEMIHS